MADLSHACHSRSRTPCFQYPALIFHLFLFLLSLRQLLHHNIWKPNAPRVPRVAPRRSSRRSGGEVAPPGASAGTISFSSRALFILQTSPSINRINSQVLGHIWSGTSYLLPERTCGASSLLRQTSGVSCSSMGSFFFFFSDRPGAAVVPPPRRGAPVQTVIAINPQFEVGFAFADVPGLGRVPAGRGGGGQTIYLQANLHGWDIRCLV